MPRENVKLVLSLYDAVERGTYASAFEVFDEEIVWDMTGLGMPDLAKTYRGQTAFLSSGASGFRPGSGSSSSRSIPSSTGTT